MSAELLREAATKIRHDANEALRTSTGGWFEPDALPGRKVCSTEDGRFIASWHPAVALAVAEWLDREAKIWVSEYPSSDPLAVARAYLGQTSDTERGTS